MSSADWIGTNDPPASSAPLFPDGHRKRYDPKAPDSGRPQLPALPPPEILGATVGPPAPWEVLVTQPHERCGGLVMLTNPIVVYGQAEPFATVRIYDEDGVFLIGKTQANPLGQWVASVNQDVPDGGPHCTKARQTLPGRPTSDLSERFCGWVGPCPAEPPQQTIDTEAARLRFSPERSWIHGTLAIRHEDTWVYGVLRKVGAPDGGSRN